jgi:predicted cobalt transporter CbtA
MEAFVMTFLRSILFTAALAALVVGVINTAADHFGTGPLIQQAETYEKAAEAAPPAGHDHSHDQAGAASATTAPGAEAAGHHHDEGAWEPADGLERTGFTLMASRSAGARVCSTVLPASFRFSSRRPSGCRPNFPERRRPHLPTVRSGGWRLRFARQRGWH